MKEKYSVTYLKCKILMDLEVDLMLVIINYSQCAVGAVSKSALIHSRTLMKQQNLTIYTYIYTVYISYVYLCIYLHTYMYIDIYIYTCVYKLYVYIQCIYMYVQIGLNVCGYICQYYSFPF